MTLIWIILVIGFIVFISIPIIGTIYGIKFLDWITRKLQDYVDKK